MVVCPGKAKLAPESDVPIHSNSTPSVLDSSLIESPSHTIGPLLEIAAGANSGSSSVTVMLLDATQPLSLITVNWY